MHTSRFIINVNKSHSVSFVLKILEKQKPQNKNNLLALLSFILFQDFISRDESWKQKRNADFFCIDTMVSLTCWICTPDS